MMARQAHAHTYLTSTTKRPIVLLRSFADEGLSIRARTTSLFGEHIRLEEALADTFWQLGPFVCIGIPGEKLPELGAARTYYPGDKWQDEVRRFVELAEWIVAVCGRTDWLQWELTIIREQNLQRKLILIVPPDPMETVEERINASLRALQIDGSAAIRNLADSAVALRFTERGATWVRGDRRDQLEYEAAVVALTAHAHSGPEEPATSTALPPMAASQATGSCS